MEANQFSLHVTIKMHLPLIFNFDPNRLSSLMDWVASRRSLMIRGKISYSNPKQTVRGVHKSNENRI